MELSNKIDIAAWKIDREHFLKLSSRRQHLFLASLAKNTFYGQADWNSFISRYEQLQNWVVIDRYQPPSWLSKKEKIEEYYYFHSLFTEVPSQHLIKSRIASSISWKPQFAVEVVIDQVRSPFNVGSILRLIDNFSFESLVHSTSWLNIAHPQLKKAARGCDKWVPVKFQSDLNEYLVNINRSVIGIENDKTAVKIWDWEVPESCVIVLGNESYGIAENIKKCCDKIVSIPMFGYKSSLNVNHSLAIIGHKIVSELTNRKNITEI